MDEQAPNYHREFLKSPQHAALGLLTLGAGFMSGMMLPLIAGVTCYALGWIYLPDLPFFRRWVDRRRDAAKRAEEMQKVAAFVQRRDALLASLSPERRECYTRLAAVCQDIETASADNLLASADPATDPRLRKLDELMWTYLRLLSIQESLEQFLETERSENLPALVKDAEAEAARLNAEVEALKAKGNSRRPGHQATLPGLAPGAAGSPAQTPATQRAGRVQPRPGRLRTGTPRPADQAHPRRCRRHQERRDAHRPH